MTTCVTFSPGATSCRRAALGTSARTRCSAPWACCSSASAAMLVPRREPATKPVGKPDAGNPHVRFDERGGETDCYAAPRPSSTLPRIAFLHLLRKSRGNAVRPTVTAGHVPLLSGTSVA